MAWWPQDRDQKGLWALWYNLGKQTLHRQRHPSSENQECLVNFPHFGNFLLHHVHKCKLFTEVVGHLPRHGLYESSVDRFSSFARGCRYPRVEVKPCASWPRCDLLRLRTMLLHSACWARRYQHTNVRRWPHMSRIHWFADDEFPGAELHLCEYHSYQYHHKKYNHRDRDVDWIWHAITNGDSHYECRLHHLILQYCHPDLTGLCQSVGARNLNPKWTILRFLARMVRRCWLLDRPNDDHKCFPAVRFRRFPYSVFLASATYGPKMGARSPTTTLHHEDNLDIPVSGAVLGSRFHHSL